MPMCVAEGKMAAKAAWLPREKARIARAQIRRLGHAKKYAAQKQSTARGADSPLCAGKNEEKNILKDKPPLDKYIQNGAPARLKPRRQN